MHCLKNPERRSNKVFFLHKRLTKCQQSPQAYPSPFYLNYCIYYHEEILMQKKNARRGLRTLSPVFVYLKLNAEIRNISGSMVRTLYPVSHKRNPPSCFFFSKITYAERDCRCLSADSIICYLQERAHSKILTICHQPFLCHSAKTLYQKTFNNSSGGFGYACEKNENLKEKERKCVNSNQQLF